jgi:hypothetical protein
LGILLGIKDQGGEVAGSDRVIVGCRERDGGFGQDGRYGNIDGF